MTRCELHKYAWKRGPLAELGTGIFVGLCIRELPKHEPRFIEVDIYDGPSGAELVVMRTMMELACHPLTIQLTNPMRSQQLWAAVRASGHRWRREYLGVEPIFL